MKDKNFAEFHWSEKVPTRLVGRSVGDIKRIAKKNNITIQIFERYNFSGGELPLDTIIRAGFWFKIWNAKARKIVKFIKELDEL